MAKRVKTKEEKIEICRQLLTHVPAKTLDAVYSLLRESTPWDSRRVVETSFKKRRAYFYFHILANDPHVFSIFMSQVQNADDNIQIVVSGFNPLTNQVFPITGMKNTLRAFSSPDTFERIKEYVTFSRSEIKELAKSELFYIS